MSFLSVCSNVSITLNTRSENFRLKHYRYLSLMHQRLTNHSNKYRTVYRRKFDIVDKDDKNLATDCVSADRRTRKISPIVSKSSIGSINRIGKLVGFIWTSLRMNFCFKFVKCRLCMKTPMKLNKDEWNKKHENLTYKTVKEGEAWHAIKCFLLNLLSKKSAKAITLKKRPKLF